MWTGETLKVWRENLGITQMEAAFRLGMTQQDYANVEQQSDEALYTLLTLACKFIWIEYVMGADVIGAMLGEDA